MTVIPGNEGHRSLAVEVPKIGCLDSERWMMCVAAGSYKDAFKGTAYYYARFRPAYTLEFFGLLQRAFHLDGTGRLLDLGCGTGQIALPLSLFFGEVVAMDPEPEMLAEAQEEIDEAEARNITLVQGGSSDLPTLIDSLGKFRLVTMGSSFHWMDRAATLDLLSRMVEPGGGIAIASSGSLWTDGTPWCRAVSRLPVFDIVLFSPPTWRRPRSVREGIARDTPTSATQWGIH